MGVYNPLIDMPVSCADCVTRGESNCYLHNNMLYPNVLKHRHKDCPLVEVKAPHGELIDRTELIKKAVVIYDHNNFERLVVSDGALADAPTIIEAEGKDE